MDPAQIEDLRARAESVLGCAGLELALSEAWSSQHKNYRRDIREALRLRLAEDQLSDLKQLPHSRTHSISVSHGRKLGGFCLLPLPGRIGFDLEEKSRVADAVAARITNEQDEKAPGAPHLWVAKEAVFKCLLLSHQPRTSSLISIHQWKPISPHTYLFRARRTDSVPDPDGYGCVLESGSLMLCFFADVSQLTSRPSDRHTSRGSRGL